MEKETYGLQLQEAEQFVIREHKKMRFGYTTGSCAAAASKAAAIMLLSGKPCPGIHLDTPKGIALYLKVEDISMEEGRVSCAIRKDAGDDPDATDGILIYSTVAFRDDTKLILEGGRGVGRVTKPGLEQPVGGPAINRVPRQMIFEEVDRVCTEYDYNGGLDIVISIPEGERIAKKTFNPRLGIMGGLSVLGTSGIVEPMSEDALIETIHADLKMRRREAASLLVVPGNYGEDFLRDTLHIPVEKAVKCSNYLGKTIDFAVEEQAEGLLLVGHIGKFIKLAAGIMNTHSRNADGRAEIFTAHAALHGADHKVIEGLMESVTTEESITILKEAGILEPVMEGILKKMEYYAEKRSYGELPVGIITFSSQHGYLGETKGAAELLEKIRR